MRTQRLGTVLGLALAVLGTTLTPAAADDPAGDRGPVVSGAVRAPGGDPLPDAEVTLWSLRDDVERAVEDWRRTPTEPAAGARTGEAGRFRLAAPRGGVWRLRVAAPGFVPAILDLVPLVDDREVPDVTLDPDAGLTVRVVDPAGAAVADATVVVTPDSGRRVFGSPGRSWQAEPRTGRTDGDGVVRVAKGDGESVGVAAASAAAGSAARRSVRGTALRLALPPTTPLALAVVGVDGAPIPGAAILSNDPEAIVLAETDADGRAVVARPAAGLSVTVVGPDDRRASRRLDAPRRKDGAPTAIILPDRRAVVGRVIDVRSRRGVADAVVWDVRDPARSAIADGSGGFVLQGPNGARLDVRAAAAGYLGDRSTPFQLTDDGRPGPTFALKPAATVAGRVVDADGEPIAGAQVTADERQDLSGMRIEIGGDASSPRALTDDRGRFKLTALDPERSWSVRAFADGFASGTAPLDGLEARKVRTGVEVRLDRGASVAGRVVDPDGAGVREASVVVTRASGPSHGMMRFGGGGGAGPVEGTTDDDGHFSIAGLPAGTVDVRIERDGFASRSVSGVELEAEGAEDLGEIPLAPGEFLQGVVLAADGLPVEGAKITVLDGAGPPMMMMLGGPPDDGEPEPDGLTDPNGWFRVDDLEAGRPYSIAVDRPGFLSRTVPGVEAPRAEPIEIRLDPSVTIAGHVTTADLDPIAGAQVVLSRSRTMESSGMMMRVMMQNDTTTDADGRFAFEDQEPGDASVSAVATGFLEVKRDGIVVPKGEDLVEVDLELPAGGVLIGRVLQPDGRPAIGATVRVAGDADPMIRMDGAATDGNGAYRLEGLEIGALSIEAVHPEYPRGVREIQVREGINSLEIELEGGQEVAGRVSGRDGAPIGGALVVLTPAGRGWGGPEARSSMDGGYSIAGVPDGDYRIRVDSADHAGYLAETTLSVAGRPLVGVDVVLDPGATLVGTIEGVEPERLASVSIRAAGPDHEFASVDRDGGYSIEHLSAGTYTVTASLPDSARQARGTVTIESNQPEARLDLRFEGGLTLTGVARQGETPVTGATLYADGVDVSHEGWTQTDLDGRFELDGLKPGAYEIVLNEFRSGLTYRETVEVTASREIELRVPTARVSGLVVDATDRRPLAGATVRLTADPPDPAGRTTALTATSDVDGRFSVSTVPDGGWRVAVSKKGYAATSRTLAVQFQSPIDDLRLEMDPTEGVTLEIRLPSGVPPDQARVAVLDGAGLPLTSGNFATGAGGRVRLASVPPGTWQVLVAAAGAAPTTVTATAPGPPVPVALRPAAGLRIVVPELAGAGLPASVALRDADGRPHTTLDWNGRPQRQWQTADGELTFAALAPGSWTIQVEAVDGRRWSQGAVATAGTTTAVVLEGDGGR